MSGGEIAAGVFEVTKKIVPAIGEFAKIDRVILDMTRLDRFQHFRPYGRMKASIFRDFLRANNDNRSVAFHRELKLFAGGSAQEIPVGDAVQRLARNRDASAHLQQGIARAVAGGIPSRDSSPVQVLDGIKPSPPSIRPAGD